MQRTDMFLDALERSCCSSERARSIATEYVLVRHPMASCSFMYGSMAVGNQSSLSDIDVLVVRSDLNQILKESVILEGYILQATILNQNLLLVYTSAARASRNVYYPTCIMQGVLLTGEAEDLSAYKRIARNVLDAKPVPLSPQEISAYRMRMANCILRIIRSSRPAETLLCMTKGLSLFVEFVTIMEEGWIYSEHSVALRAFRKRHPGLSADLESAVLGATETKEVTTFIDKLLAAMESYGGVSVETECLAAG